MSNNATSTTIANTVAVAAAPIVASKPLVTTVAAILDLQSKLKGKFASTANVLRTEADTKGLDRKSAGLLLSNAYEAAYAKLGHKDAELARLVASSGPDRSKILVLAYPANDAAKAELDKAVKAGLGLNAQFEIARGKTTVDQVIAERAENKAAPKGARTPDANIKSATTSTPEAQAAAAKVAGISPEDKFGNEIAALKALGKALGISADRQQELLIAAYAAE